MTVHCWGEDPRGLWTVIVTDNDNNNREHYLQKLTQGDEEDVTRIFLDDTGKHSQTGQKDHAKDHILKTIEDTEGKIFKESRFFKFAHGKKSQHVRNSPRINVTKKVKHHPKKVKESKMAHLKKHYLKTKTKSKTKVNKEKQSWSRKHINRHPNAIKVKQARKISKKYVAAKKLTSKTVLSQSPEKPKGPFKKHDNGRQRNKALKDSKQKVNATLTEAQKLATTFSKSSISALSNLSTSANATRALGLISQLISEIQKNPLVTKIALEALKNPAIGKLFGIDSSRDAAENIQERLFPIASIKHKTQDLENGSESNSSGAHIDTRIVDRDSVSGLKEKSNHLEMIKPGTIKSVQQKHFQFFKILKDSEEDYKNDENEVNGSGIDGSGMSGSGYYFDRSGSGNEEGLQAANHQVINCGGSKNCTENSLLSVSSEPHKVLEKEENSYEMLDEDNTESQYGEGDGDEVFEDPSRPVGSVEDSEDLIPEFGFDLRAISESDLDLCNFSAVLSNGSSIVTQKARCVENDTIEKRTDERDKEDKTLAHYLAVDKLKSASGDYGLDSGDDQDGSSSKIDGDDDNQNIDQDDSDEKYNGKDLVVLQEALEDQLSRLSKDPASEKSNKEILARVRDDIKRGDIDDLELLEAQISGGKTDLSRVIRSNTPEDDEIDGLDGATEETPEIFEGYNGEGEGEDLQRRRISHKAINKEKRSQTYYVNPDKYGKVNSGILESWTLILYGTK